MWAFERIWFWDMTQRFTSLSLLAGLTIAVAVTVAGPVVTAVDGLAQARSSGAAQPGLATAGPADALAVPRRVVVRFLTEGDFPPFNYVDEEGVLAGFNVDLARAICQQIGAACDIKVKPWGELLLGLKRGEADAVIAAHRASPQLLTQVDLTDRYFYTPGRFAAKKGAVAEEILPENLGGVSIGVARGTAHEAFLKTFFRDSRIVRFETAELAREALRQGKVKLIFDDGISLVFWLNGTLARQCCELTGGPFLEPKYFGDGLAIAVPKTDPEIKMMINEALRGVRESGRFQELVERYFPARIY